MMNNAIKKRGSNLGIGENIVPVSKFEVGSNDNGFTLITFGNDLKEEFVQKHSKSTKALWFAYDIENAKNNF